MDKNEYKIILSDETAREIERIAHQTGSDISEVIGQIITGHLKSAPTAKNTLVEYVNENLEQVGGFRAHTRPDGSIHIKSYLRHEHRPELKFSLQFSNPPPGRMGSVKLALRDNDIDALRRFHQFIRDWEDIESHYVKGHFDPALIQYAEGSGSFTRVFMQPKSGGEYTQEALGRAISAYVNALDTALKLYLENPGVGRSHAEQSYLRYMGFGILF